MHATYREPDEGFARFPGAALIAGLLGTAGYFGGRVAGGPAREGALSFLAPVAGVLQADVPLTGGALSWAMAGLIASSVGLFVALITTPRRKGLALISLLALVFFALMLAGWGRAPLAEDRFDEPDLPAATADVVEVVEPAPLICSAEQFALDGVCAPCLVSREVRSGPALVFVPVRTDAAWGYAEDDAVASAGAGTMPLGRLNVGGDALCVADAALVLGSASSDGPAGRNIARAERRAKRLADEMGRRCPGLPIYAATLGQSAARTDLSTDRAVTVLAVTAEETTVSPRAVELELGHALATGLGGAPLLTRLHHFSDEWVWVAGGQGRFRPDAIARPTTIVELPHNDAPARCGSGL